MCVSRPKACIIHIWFYWQVNVNMWISFWAACQITVHWMANKTNQSPTPPTSQVAIDVAFPNTTNVMTDWLYSTIQALGALRWGVTTLGTRFSRFDRNDGRECPFRRHGGRPQTQLRPAGKHDEDQRLRLQPGPRSPGRDEVVPHHGLSGQQAWPGNSGDQPHGEKNVTCWFLSLKTMCFSIVVVALACTPERDDGDSHFCWSMINCWLRT